MIVCSCHAVTDREIHRAVRSGARTAGQVAEVTVLSAQLKDKEFRKAVVAEAAKWNFSDIAPEGTVIDCPLLFVREGMDIATVMNWEKTLMSLREEHAPAKSIPQARVAKKK